MHEGDCNWCSKSTLLRFVDPNDTSRSNYICDRCWVRWYRIQVTGPCTRCNFTRPLCFLDPDDEKQQKRICDRCYRRWLESERTGFCPKCRCSDQALMYCNSESPDPRNPEYVCKNCYRTKVIGVCKCGATAPLAHLDPSDPTRHICNACYQKWHREQVIGTCPRCLNAERKLLFIDWESPDLSCPDHICEPCHNRWKATCSVGTCPQCHRPELPLLYPDRESPDPAKPDRICEQCSEQQNARECPLCHEKKMLRYVNPNNKKERICGGCWETWRKEQHMGPCPLCFPTCKKEKPLTSWNPNEPEQRICRNCRSVLSGKERLGKCPRCKRERPLTKSNPYKPEEWVCTSCAATLRKWKREGRVYVCPEPDAPDEATAA